MSATDTKLCTRGERTGLRGGKFLTTVIKESIGETMSRLSEERIDEFLEAVLNAGGSSLRYYTLPKSVPAMREAARAIEREAYKAGQERMRERVLNGNCSLCRDYVRNLEIEEPK